MFYCSSCVKRKVEKEKHRIHAEQQECRRLKNEVDHSLSVCMNGQAFSFIRDYLANEPSHNQAIARLAQQLLTVQILDQKRTLEKLKARAAAIQTQTVSLRDEICATESEIALYKERASSGLRKLREERLLKATKYKNSYLDEKLPTIDKLLLSSKTKLFSHLTTLFAVRTSRTKSFKLTMNYVPILSPKLFVGCSSVLVNASLEALSRFLFFTSRFLLIKLPHEIIINDEEGNTVCNLQEQYALGLRCDFCNLTPAECDAFCKALGCLVIDLLFLIEARSQHTESKSYNQLLQLDELCWALIYNDDYRSFFMIDDSNLAISPQKAVTPSVMAEVDMSKRSWLSRVFLRRRSSKQSKEIAHTTTRDISVSNFGIMHQQEGALKRSQLHSPLYLAKLFSDYFEGQRSENPSKANEEIWEVL